MLNEKKKFQASHNILSSFVSSIFVKSCVAPIERIKIFMQTDLNNKGFQSTNKGAEIVQYRKYVKVKTLIACLSLADSKLPVSFKARRFSLVLEWKFDEHFSIFSESNVHTKY